MIYIKPTGRSNCEESIMQNKQSSFEKLLASASFLFLEKGYDAVSVNDICKHAGVSKGAFTTILRQNKRFS